MRSIHIVALVLASILPLLGVGAMAQDRPLRPVGSVTFEPEPAVLEKDLFTLRPQDRRIRSLRIRAEKGSADVRSLNVIYADGQSEPVRVRQLLVEGQRTALFRLAEPRPVRAIEISYIPRGAVTLVLLADTGPVAPVAEWVELGCKSVGFLADRDTLQVNSPDRFKALRLRSSGYDIELVNMVVRYANGGRDNLAIRQLIPSGSRSSPIDLRGERRRISEIEFLYRTSVISTIKTKLCVEGLKADDAEAE